MRTMAKEAHIKTDKNPLSAEVFGSHILSCINPFLHKSVPKRVAHTVHYALNAFVHTTMGGHRHMA
jgi:hypothetical protein